MVLLHDLKVSQRRRARDRMRRVGIGVHVLLRRVVGERVRELLARDARGERDVAGGDALRHGHQVGDDPVVLHGKPSPRPSEPGDHLVGDQQDIQFVADRSHPAQPANGRHDEPTRREHGLLDHGRDSVRPLAQDRLAQLARAPLDQLIVGAVAPVAERVRCRHFREAGGTQHVVGRGQMRQPADRERPHGRAVIAAVERDHLVLVALALREPVLSRDLHRPLVRFRAADREHRDVEVTRRQ